MTSIVTYQKGQLPRGVHQNLGGLKDDLLGRGGFQGRQAHLYRRNDPADYRSEAGFKSRVAAQQQLSPSDEHDPAGSPLRLVHNADVQLWISRRGTPMPFYRRNVEGDEAHFVHRGTGVVETEFGPIPYEPGDLVVIPKGVTHRIVPDHADNVFFITETVEELEVPDFGPVGRYTPLDPNLIYVPEPEVLPSPHAEYEVRLKHGSEHWTITYDHNPCDVEGWRGDYFPWKYNIRDFKLLNSDSAHLMPTAHTLVGTAGGGVYLGFFKPHRAPQAEGVEKAPPYHRNADYDEAAFMHGGEFFGAPVPPGLFQHTPQGLHHGPPEKVKQRIRDEYPREAWLNWEVVVVDAKAPLVVDEPLVKAAEEAMAAGAEEM
ncbi:homogentisate 1,2-dioxygenase [Streptomyces sp. NPDC050619]|uniref:homogentisate 1,2-dioxygenase n=1 Tax=Streptomyces sp. NPDC050619 TaxID=3157214 RepID=UPI003426ACD5